MTIRLRCRNPKCQHTWDYKGTKTMYTSCPSCHYNCFIPKARVEVEAAPSVLAQAPSAQALPEPDPKQILADTALTGNQRECRLRMLWRRSDIDPEMLKEAENQRKAEEAAEKAAEKAEAKERRDRRKRGEPKPGKTCRLTTDDEFEGGVYFCATSHEWSKNHRIALLKYQKEKELDTKDSSPARIAARVKILDWYIRELEKEPFGLRELGRGLLDEESSSEAQPALAQTVEPEDDSSPSMDDEHIGVPTGLIFEEKDGAYYWMSFCDHTSNDGGEDKEKKGHYKTQNAAIKSLARFCKGCTENIGYCKMGQILAPGEHYEGKYLYTPKGVIEGNPAPEQETGVEFYWEGWCDVNYATGIGDRVAGCREEMEDCCASCEKEKDNLDQKDCWKKGKHELVPIKRLRDLLANDELKPILERLRQEKTPDLEVHMERLEKLRQEKLAG